MIHKLLLRGVLSVDICSKLKTLNMILHVVIMCILFIVNISNMQSHLAIVELSLSSVKFTTRSLPVKLDLPNISLCLYLNDSNLLESNLFTR